MNTKDFLAMVLPDGENFFVAEVPPKGSGPVKHFLATSPHELARKVVWREEESADSNVYYAMASFKQPEYMVGSKKKKRTQDNVDRLKCFWVDLDCKGKGDGSDYATQAEAILDIKRLCDTTGLPLPTIVNSGYGIHGYWVLTESIEKDAWVATASRFKQTLDTHGVRHDASCTTDCARILRPVGAHNRKDGTVREVKLIGPARDAIDLSVFASKLVLAPIMSYGQYQGVDLSMNDAATSAVEFRPSSIKEVVKECGLLREVGKVGGNVPEPLWHKVLGLVKHTIEGEKAIHFFSKGHPDYTPEDTIAKADAWGAGPASCKSLCENSPPGLKAQCSACKHNGSVVSPISLGYPKTIVVEQPVITVSGLTTAAVEIPALPPSMDGRFKWESGKLWKSCEDKDASKTAGSPVFVWLPFCNSLFYPTGHYRDADEKHQMMWSLHERNVTREFTLSGGSLGTGGAPLFKELGENGITALTGGKSHMEAYLSHWSNEIKKNAAATETFMRFGWHGDGFLLGDTMITPTGNRTVKVGGDANAMVKHLSPQGNVDAWSRLVNEAYCHAGMEPYQFLIGTAFGSILVPFMNVAGGSITSAISYGTGQGKTTACRVGFSIYGCPEENTQVTLSRSSVTHKAIFTIAGILHNIPVLVDEMTNIDGKELSDIVYTWSQGQPRIRLIGTGELAPVGFGWAGAMMQSSNKPMTTIIANAKPGADAELARLVEFDCSGMPKLPKDRADNLFKELRGHYGVAAHKYIPYVVSHLQEVKDLLVKTQVSIDRRFGFTGQNRYWSANYTTAIVGLIVAKRVGLVDFDLARVMSWCDQQSRTMRGEIVSTTSSDEELFSSMLNDLAPGIVVTDIEGGRGAGGKDAYVIKEPNARYTGRAILDIGIAYLMQPAVYEWCSKKQVDPKAIIQSAYERGWVKSVVPEKRYPGKGTNYAMGQTRCYLLDWGRLENSTQSAPHLAEVVHMMGTGTSK